MLRMRTWTIAMLAAGIPAVLWWLYLHGERLSERWLRVGGRVVQYAVQRPNRTAAAFAAVVLLMWIIVGLRCLWESWQERPRAPRGVAMNVDPVHHKT